MRWLNALAFGFVQSIQCVLSAERNTLVHQQPGVAESGDGTLRSFTVGQAWIQDSIEMSIFSYLNSVPRKMKKTHSTEPNLGRFFLKEVATYCHSKLCFADYEKDRCLAVGPKGELTSGHPGLTPTNTSCMVLVELTWWEPRCHSVFAIHDCRHNAIKFTVSVCFNRLWMKMVGLIHFAIKTASSHKLGW